MARSSRTGGKAGAAKMRKAPSVKGRNPGKTKQRPAPTASRSKRSSRSDLGKELKEAREQQAATAEILKVIASSPVDVQPAFDAIAASANRLMGGHSAAVFRFIDGVTYLKAFTPTTPEADEVLRNQFPMPVSNFPLAQQNVLSGDTEQIPDTETGKEFQIRLARARGFRSIMFSPLMHQGTAIGMISVTRREPGLFADHHVQLMRTFADQAVIAIENARLFNETREALERQTATAEILNVIARSPSDVQPVFEAIAASARHLIGGHSSAVTRVVGDELHLAASAAEGEIGKEALARVFPMPLASPRPLPRVARTGEVVILTDTESRPDDVLREMARARGYRSMLGVPMLRDGVPVGTISVTRAEPGGFDDKTVDLLKTFADQAVIAIENARLFNETQEALERQTATADILKVIASSPSDVQPVFEAIAERSNRLLDGLSTAVYSLVDDVQHLMAFTRTSPAADAALQSTFPRPLSAVFWGDAIRKGENFRMSDSEAELVTQPSMRELARLRGWRSALLVPLVRDQKPIGTVSVTRAEPGPFADHHVQLLQTFADQAVIAIENSRLLRELRQRTDDLSEALIYQTGSSNILKVIASSPTDVGPALQAIVESACEICNAYDSAVLLKIGDDLHYSAHHGPIPAGQRSVAISREWVTGRSVVDKVPVQMSDFEAPEAVEFPEGQRHSREQGHRCTLAVPLLREGEAIGAIVLRRLEPVAFNDRQIDILQTFADQAVIAIGNVRLFEEVQAKTRDLEEALTYQTGSASVLNVIASSPTDIEPVLNAIVEGACELCEANDAAVLLKDGEHLRFRAHHGPIDINLEKWQITRGWTAGRAFLDGKPVHLRDTESEEAKEFPDSRALAVPPYTNFSVRTVLSVPLLRESERVGAILLRRIEMRPFSDKQIALLQTFADQAVIAINNARLFDEVQTKSHDLEEALRYQTGSANILKVIASSPTDVQPVLNAIVESACELCEAYDAVLTLRDGAEIRLSAHRGPIPMSRQRWVDDRTSLSGRAMADQQPVHVPDVLSDESRDFAIARDMSATDGCRTLLSAPLLREGESIGAIVLRRTEVHPFSDKQIALLQTFADQAVIAIGNVRLFEEVQARTRELSESLQQQTATADVLQVISSSPGDLAPVFDKMLVNATRVCSAKFGSMLLAENGSMRPAAQYNVPAEFAAARGDRVLTPHPKSALAKAISTKQVVHVADMRTTEAYLERSPASIELVELGGARTVAIVPMLREDEVIGAITVYRNEVQLFSDKQIELLSNFAKQAVIAIENARLLKELRQRTDDLSESLEQQTATSEVLEVISASTGELEPVFKSMLDNATRICGANFGTMSLYENGAFRPVAFYNVPQAYAEKYADTLIRPHPQGPLGTVARTHEVVHVEDTKSLPVYIEGNPAIVAISDLAGARTIVIVPMLRENELIGTIAIYRQEVRPFSEKQISLLTNFAKQAVIAIENTRLLKELRQRTGDLSQSLDDLRSAQDRLIQTEKLASLGQLTAGIAHEIKNPLNFVNNFSALSAELTDELNDVLKPVTLDSKVRGEVDELTGLLKDNLEKVVQHGKRADSIVKNMLLHSREGSREHRPADINSLLEESLNLAYHGARAEKGEFNITLQRDFDADAGTIELFPQEITRAFLNLIANGVYAATRRKTEDKEPGFEPTLRASTKNLGTTVEIRIRDNGTGIPAEVQEKMFNPFFTTKPAGQGTGLGLSMTHDIIVKQHGGRIDVATEVGQFTEFTIVLPRRSNLSGGDRGKT
jgi:GAF domain-containing protein